MFRKSQYVIFILLALFPVFVARASADLTGTFRNATLSISLHPQDQYFAGTAIAGGREFPVVLQVLPGALVQGYYTDAGQQFPIVGTLQENSLNLLIDGVEFLLTKETAPVTPAAASVGNSAARPLTGNGNETGDKYLGFKFTPPAGWEAQFTGAGYLLVSRTEKGFIVVLPHEYSTVEQIKIATREGLADQNGTNLQVSGSPQSFGASGIAVEFSGVVQGQAARGRAISLLSPYGGGITILAAVEQATYSTSFARYVESIAQTVVFSKPEIPPVAEQWRQQLANCRLTYLWSYYSGGGSDGAYAGGSQQTVIDLCAQGFFRYSDHNQMAVDGGNAFGAGASGFGGGSNQGNGTWKITARGAQPVLVLAFHDGRVQEYRLSQQDGKTFLDDKRFFRTYANDPNPEHRPVCQ